MTKIGGPMSQQHYPDSHGWLLPLSVRSRHVFISHAAEDVEIAYNVAAMLKRYLDINSYVHESFLRAGRPWRSDLEGKIQSSELLLVLRSRVVDADASPGVRDEVRFAQSLNIPIIFGRIRGVGPAKYYHDIDFGEDGTKIGAAWDLAKYLLSESHPYRVLGLGSISVGKSPVSSILGDPETIASRAGEISVIGHTMKQWLGNYGNAIRHAEAAIKMYFPAAGAIGMDLLVASHRNGEQVLTEISRAKQLARTLEEEIADVRRFNAFVIPVKPMFSATVLEPIESEALIVLDWYSFRVGAESRPKTIVRGRHTPLFRHYYEVVNGLVADAEPLASEDVSRA